jgi:hypothetical protein
MDESIRSSESMPAQSLLLSACANTAGRSTSRSGDVSSVVPIVVGKVGSSLAFHLFA